MKDLKSLVRLARQRGGRITLDGTPGVPCWLAVWTLPPGHRTRNGCPDATLDVASWDEGLCLLAQAQRMLLGVERT